MSYRRNSPLTLPVETSGRLRSPFANLAHMFRCPMGVPQISKLTWTPKNKKAVRGESSSTNLTEFFVRPGKSEDALLKKAFTVSDNGKKFNRAALRPKPLWMVFSIHAEEAYFKCIEINKASFKVSFEYLIVGRVSWFSVIKIWSPYIKSITFSIVFSAGFYRFFKQGYFEES